MAANRTGVTGRIAAGLAVLATGIMWTSRPSAQQEPSLNIQFHGFTDSRGVTVLSPMVDLDRDFTDRTGLRLRFGVDGISAASDSCIRCHATGARNLRQFVSASIVRKLGDTSISFGGEFSKEFFYQATTGFGSISRTFNGANTTVTGGYSFSANQPELHPSEFVESQRAHSTFASLTQTLTRTTIAQVGYEFALVDGYQSNPFLRAVVNGIRVVGEAPAERRRHSWTARVRQALPAETYVEADYRRYTDDWKLTANTYSVGLAHYFTPEWYLGATYRLHAQTGVYFYAPSYTGTPEFFTADFRLFPFESDLYTGRVTYAPARGLLGMPSGSALTLQYEFYNAATGFQSATFSSGLRIPLNRR